MVAWTFQLHMCIHKFKGDLVWDSYSDTGWLEGHLCKHQVSSSLVLWCNLENLIARSFIYTHVKNWPTWITCTITPRLQPRVGWCKTVSHTRTSVAPAPICQVCYKELCKNVFGGLVNLDLSKEGNLYIAQIKYIYIKWSVELHWEGVGWVSKEICQALEPLLVSLITIQTPAVECGFRVRVRWWTRYFCSIQVLEGQPKQIRALWHSSRMFERPHPSVQTHSSYRVFTRIMNCSILYFVAANKDMFYMSYLSGLSFTVLKVGNGLWRNMSI
jgi:hypothetical protein